MQTLIVGGSSGLGLALAKEFADKGDKVIVSGRHKPEVDFVEFRELDLSAPDLPQGVENFIKTLPQIDCLIYAAGFWKQAPITALTDEQIEEKINIGARGIIYTLRGILRKQETLNTLIVITSMSQWNASKEEPVYNFVKAGQANLSQGLSKDGLVEKILVVAPGDMREGSELHPADDTSSTSLNKQWVAEQVEKALHGDYKYKLIKVLGKPARVIEVDKR